MHLSQPGGGHCPAGVGEGVGSGVGVGGTGVGSGVGSGVGGTGTGVGVGVGGTGPGLFPVLQFSDPSALIEQHLSRAFIPPSALLQ